MLAAFSCACDDDKDDSCVNGTRICNGSGVRAECVDGDYVEIPCSVGSICDNGACKQLTDNCVNGSPAYSIDGVSISYCVNGRTVTEACPAGYTVGMGSYGSYCVPPINSTVVDSGACSSEGAQRCSAMGVHQVCKNFRWVDQPCSTNADEAASWKCESGECVHYTVCYPGQLSCDGTTVLKCAKGAKENLWKKDVDCAADSKVCKAGKCVSSGGSSSSKLTCDDYESQYGACEMQSGGTCKDYCKSQGSNECYVDLDQGIIDCGGSTPTPSGDYMTCDEIDEQYAAQGGCVLTSGETCQEVCKAEGSDVCYISLTDGALICEDPNGGTTPGGDASCDLFDCSNTKFSNGQTGKQICAAEGEFSVPLCDDEGLYCLKRESGKDSSCTDGEAYTYQKQGGGTGTDCFVIGSDESCLGGGGSSSGGDSDYFYCGDDAEVAAECGKQIGICETEGSKTYYDCYDACSASAVGQTRTSCMDMTSYGYGYITFNQTCMEVDGYYAYITSYDNYKQCSSTCNSAGTACK